MTINHTKLVNGDKYNKDSNNIYGFENQYLSLMQEIMLHGEERDNRTGVKAYSIFGAQFKIDISNYYPLLTTKKVYFPGIAHELLWFFKAESSIHYLKENKVRIWNEWAYNNDIGPMYGIQWRKWQSGDQYIDQLTNVIEQIKNNPESRRLIISAWNAGYLPDVRLSPQENVKNGKMALAPCHVICQFYVNKKRLSCSVYQRSADIFLGLPFNIASYTLLTYIIAQQTGLKPGKLVWTGGDVHLYSNHIDQANIQLQRNILTPPKLNIICEPKSNLADYCFEDFELLQYQHHEAIKAPIAV